MHEEASQDEMRSAEMTRKVKLLEEQVQYLERRLESCRQESALKLSSVEGQLGIENGRLKTRDRDLRRKLQRDREINKHQTALVRDLTAELKRNQENNRKVEFSEREWTKYVRLPGPDGWSTIKLGTQQNKKALRHIFQQVEKEGGPPTNLDPSLFLHCVVLFLWWKREATVKLVQENEAISGRGPRNCEAEELRDINSALQQRVRTLEDTLDDCRAERQTFETTMATNLNQLLRVKYELSNKAAHLEDTVSALHLDNNLLRADVHNNSISRDVKMNLDKETADLKARLLSSESELRQSHLHKEQLENELDLASKRIQTLEQDAMIRDAVCKEHTERLTRYDVKREELEKMTSQSQEKMQATQHNLELMEETRDTLKKERDSFLSQLTSALNELDNAKDKLQEQRLEISRMSVERAHYTHVRSMKEIKILNSKDDLIQNLGQDLASQKEAQAELREEKEKCRSLEMTLANHDRIVKELEKRIHNEEMENATLLAELCGTQTEERERMERLIETLEQERDAMIKDIETLTDEKLAAVNHERKLRGTLRQVSTKLRSMIQGRALRLLPPLDVVEARRTKQSNRASVGTDPLTTQMTLVGSEEPNEPINGTQVSRDLEELIELFVIVADSSFVDDTADVRDWDLLVGLALNASERADDLDDYISPTAWEDREAGADDNSDEGDLKSRHPQLGAYKQAQRDVIARLQSLALMMQARRTAREKGSQRQRLSEPTCDHSDVCEQVKEPMLSKQEQQLFDNLENQKESGHDSARNAPKQQRGSARQHRTTNSREGATGRYLSKDLQSTYETEQTDQEQTDSENEDLLSTLEREQRRLKLELAEIKEAEAQADERLEREEEAHLTSLRSLNEYQEECVRMQMEKEELLPEPDSLEEVLEDGETDTDEMGSTLHGELERMFLEELASLKEENEHLMAERFQQQVILAEEKEGLMNSIADLSVLNPRQSETESSQKRNASFIEHESDDNKWDLEANVEEVHGSPREATTKSKPRLQKLQRQCSVFSQPDAKQPQLNNQKHINRTTHGDRHWNSPNSGKTGVPPALEIILPQSDDRTTESSLTESGDKPEADQGQERHDLETKLEEQKGQNTRDLVKQACVKDPLANLTSKVSNNSAPNHGHLPRGSRLVSFSDEDRLLENGASDEKASSRPCIQKQNSLEEDLLEGNTGESGEDLTQDAIKDRKPASTVNMAFCKQNVTGTIREGTKQYLDLQSVSEGVQPMPGKTRHALISTESDTHELERNLSESRAAICELLRDRHALQDKLTGALQTNVRLQKLVDGLRAKADSLQTKLTKSNELVSVLQHDKDHVQGTCTVAQEERRSIQRDLRESIKRIESLDAQLRMSEERAKRSKTECDTLENMYVAEQAKTLELQNRVAQLGKELDYNVREEEKLQQSIRTSRSLKPRTRQLPDFQSDDCSFSEINTQHTREMLHKQLEEQIDRILDLENKLDDSRCVIKDLERERDILQNDFIGMLQTRSEMKTKLSEAEDQVQNLTRNLEESEILVGSLKREIREYLHQDSYIEREQVATLKTRPQEMHSDRQHLVADKCDVSIPLENLEGISKMNTQWQLQDKVELVGMETDLENLQTKRRGKNLLQRGKPHTDDASPGSDVPRQWDKNLRVPGQDRFFKTTVVKTSTSKKPRVVQRLILEDVEDHTATLIGMPSTAQAENRMHYEDALLNLRKTNIRLSFDLHLTRQSLETKTKKCWNLQESLYDVARREHELAKAMTLLQKQLTTEVEMQAKFAKRSEEQEAEIFRLRNTLRKQPIQEDPSTTLDQDQNIKPTRLNEMLTGFSREIQSHLDDHMEKTQLQNETDDRKKVQELEIHLSSMNAQLSVDRITIQSLSDDNRRLRAMVYKLKERIADNQMVHQKDSRLNAVYQALARAQVRVIATSMAEGSQAFLNVPGALGNPMARSYQRSRRRIGAGNSLEGSYE